MTTGARLLSGDLYRGPDFLGRCEGVVFVEGGRPRYGTVSAGLQPREAARLVGVPLTIYARGLVLHVEAIDVVCCGEGLLCVRFAASMGPVGVLEPAALEAR
jgi:hypothetical protein